MNDANGPKRDAKSGLPMFNRLARAGSGGLAAASIGWTLAFCIVGGALAGIALDKHFGTQYWTPILFLAGVAAGFLQMVRTLADANRLEEAERKAQCGNAPGVTPRDAATPSGFTSYEAASEAAVPARASRVPAPPTASFHAGENKAAPVELPPDVSDDLARLRQMLAEERGDAPKDDNR